MKKIALSDNHKRVLESSIYLIEKLSLELEQELNGSNNKIMNNVINDEDEKKIYHINLLIQEIKAEINFITIKYNLKPVSHNLSQFIDSRKAKMWEILCDTKPEKLKGWGNFPKKYSKELDSDVDKLLKLVESI
ncbi:hypothetical protein [Lutibacter sp.]|uniref:hypothetical protein n=1 Tax=Lutibacter sp. TaxID=1925666 RepID=UPI0025C5914E|nr:hypothetical protein [Lutibacter sp.]MCF6182615.1 hypothetical protein [Lutibacter sp.]